MKKILLFLLILAAQKCISQTITFAPFTARATGSWATFVKIADMNNDGRNDVIMGLDYYFDPANDFTVQIFYQDSTGNYTTSPQKLNSPVGMSSFAIGDIDNDGRMDVIIAGGNTMAIFKQKTQGAFTLQKLDCGMRINNIAVGDVSNNGKADDIVVAGSNGLRVYYSITDSLVSTWLYPTPSGNCTNLKIGDVTGDGRNDVVAQQNMSMNIHIFPQLENGLLGTVKTVSIPYTDWWAWTNSIALGDLNGDGKTDMAVTSGGNRPYTWLYTFIQKNGDLILSQTLDAYEIPSDVAIEDLNCDGNSEIIVAHSGWTRASVYTNSSAQPGTFSSYSLFGIPYASWYDPGTLAVGDINSDNRKDIVIADYNNGIVMLKNTTAWATKKDTVTATASTTDTTRTSQTKVLKSKWQDVENGYFIRHMDSVYVNTYSIHKQECFDTTIVTTFIGCAYSKPDSTTKHFCVNTVYGYSTTNETVYTDTIRMVECNTVLYPNPTTDAVTILSGTPLGEVMVYTSDGRLVGKYFSNTTQLTINFTSFSKGVYFIKTKTCTKKIMKM
jgi:hypothetical protein